jgi:hypothetical protein
MTTKPADDGRDEILTLAGAKKREGWAEGRSRWRIKSVVCGALLSRTKGGSEEQHGKERNKESTVEIKVS